MTMDVHWIEGTGRRRTRYPNQSCARTHRRAVDPSNGLVDCGTEEET